MAVVIKRGLGTSAQYFVGWSEDPERDPTWSSHQESGMRFEAAEGARELLTEIHDEDARPVKLRPKKER